MRVHHASSIAGVQQYRLHVSGQGVIVQESVETAISELRRTHRVESDAALARKLGIDRSTISTWRARGQVPARFLDIIRAEPKERKAARPELWGEVQDRAHAIALLRYTLISYEIAKSEDVPSAIRAFRDNRIIWLLINRAVHDMREKQKIMNLSDEAAQEIIMHDDLRDPAHTAARVRQELAEDFADNPWLDSWLPQTS